MCLFLIAYLSNNSNRPNNSDAHDKLNSNNSVNNKHSQIHMSTNNNGDADEEIVDIDQIIKILVVGNAKCGKSSIIGQYISKSFDKKYRTTVGADFARKDLYVELPKSQQKIGVRLQLWDIAGQDRFQKLTRAYFSKVNH